MKLDSTTEAMPMMVDKLPSSSSIISADRGIFPNSLKRGMVVT